MQQVVSHGDTAVLRFNSGESRPHAYEYKPASDMHRVGYSLTLAGCTVSLPHV